MRIAPVFLVLAAVFASSASTAEISAHRGEHLTAPENTVPAFIAAVREGAKQVEFDVHSTKDGELVLMHDASVDRTTNGKGKIAELTFSEIRALDAGAKFDPKFAGTKVPTLREALKAVPPSILCNVHIGGNEQTAVRAARLIRDMKRLRQCFLTIGTTQNDYGRAARAVAPNIMICKGAAADGVITPATVSLAADSTAASPNAKERVDFIQLFFMKPGTPPLEQLREAVRKLHEMGVKVNYCCSSDGAKIRELAEAGVDFILTDDILLGREALGKAAPKGKSGK